MAGTEAHVNLTLTTPIVLADVKLAQLFALPGSNEVRYRDPLMDTALMDTVAPGIVA